MKHLITFSLILFSILILPLSVNAQVDIGKEFKPPLYTPGQTPAQGILGVGTLVGVLLANSYIVAGILLLIFILLGGFSMISGAGSNDNQKKAQAKMAVTWAVGGFLIIFASYWIIEYIQTLTGIKII